MQMNSRLRWVLLHSCGCIRSRYLCKDRTITIKPVCSSYSFRVPSGYWVIKMTNGEVKKKYMRKEVRMGKGGRKGRRGEGRKEGRRGEGRKEREEARVRRHSLLCAEPQGHAPCHSSLKTCPQPLGEMG